MAYPPHHQPGRIRGRTKLQLVIDVVHGEIWADEFIDGEAPDPVCNTYTGSATAYEVEVFKAEWRRRAAILREVDTDG